MSALAASAAVVLGSAVLSAPVASIAASAARRQEATAWRPLATGADKPLLRGVSGIARVGGEGVAAPVVLLVVHDNKNPDEPRAGLLTLAPGKPPAYRALKWQVGDAPVDLEAVAAVPEADREFVALVSAGKLFHVALDPDAGTLTARKSWDLPEVKPGNNFEGFALHGAGDALVAVWGERGAADRPGQISWATLDLKSYAFGKVGTARLSAPLPQNPDAPADIRAISELKVDRAGVVYASAAADPGNDGPFASALYVAGTLTGSGAQATFTLNPAPVRLRHFALHKVEGFELLPGAAGGGLAFGTDDENYGAFLLVDGNP